MDVKIVGIVLVQNEEIYIERVLSNIAEFCDEIIVADHRSKDRTAEIVKKFHRDGCKLSYRLIKKPSESHDLIKTFAGTPAWVFAVDGDEIYDPEGLCDLRLKILSGKFSDTWMILGNVLNCVELNLVKGLARGYLAPPCRSMTKLYNFQAISAWGGPCPERLHGGSIKFKEGYDKSMRLELYKNTTWEASEFRCLHLCFIKRSSLEKRDTGKICVRKNISDKSSEGFLQKVMNYWSSFIRKDQTSMWKSDKYMRGELVRKNIEAFIPPFPRGKTEN